MVAMLRTENGWIDQYKKKNALWIHDGNPKHPHALLTSGKHSNGFFNSREVIPDEGLLREAASDLVESFALLGEDLRSLDGVVGPQTGATTLARLICEELTLGMDIDYFWASPAKHDKDGKKSMVFSDEDRKILPHRWVLLCEDVLTTGGSVELAAQAVIDAGGVVFPYVLVLVNRSGLKEVNGRKIVALIDRSMPIWEADECPLCKGGSEALRPKDNWVRLNAVN